MLLPDPDKGVLQGDDRLHRQGVQHVERDQHRHDVAQADLASCKVCEGGNDESADSLLGENTGQNTYWRPRYYII